MRIGLGLGLMAGMRANGGGGIVVANQSAIFPTLTPANAGGFRPYSTTGVPVELTGAVTVVSGSPTRTWSISGGYLVANGTPAVDNGVVLGVTTTGGAPVQITIDASIVGYAVRQWSEVVTVLAVGASLDGRSMVARCGNTITIDPLYNFAGTMRNWPGSGFTIRSDRTDLPDVLWPVFSGLFRFNTVAASAGPLDCYGVAFYRPLTQADERPITYTITDTVRIEGAGTYKAFDLHDCLIYSDMTSAMTGGYLLADIAGVTIRANGTAADTIKVRNNLIRNVNTGIFVRGSNALIDSNTVTDIYTDHITHQNSSNLKITRNLFLKPIGCYAWLHPDTIHFQENGNVTNVLVEGNVSLLGEWWNNSRGGGVTPVAPATVILATSTTLTAAAHSGRLVRPSASGITITLPDPATMPEQTIWIIGLDASSVARNPTISCAYPSNIIFPLTLDVNYQGAELAVRASSDGTRWDSHWRGVRLATHVRKTVTTPLATDNNAIILYDVADGDIAVTLPTSGVTSMQAAMLMPVPGRKVTISPGAGDTMTGGPLVISEYWQWYTLTKTASNWVAALNPPFKDGIFGNNHSSRGWTFSDVVWRHNVLQIASATHGITLPDDFAGNVVEYNTVITAPEPTGRWAGLFLPAINLTAATQVHSFVGKNIVTDKIVGWNRKSLTGVNMAIPPGTTYTAALAMYETYFQGAGFDASTVAGFVAQIRPEAAYAASGAVPATDGEAGRWNWTTNARVPATSLAGERSYPAQGATVVPSDVSAWLDFDTAIKLGPGAVTLRRASDDVDQVATIATQGNRLLVTKAGLSSATEYYVQAAADAVEAYSADCFTPAIAKGKWNFTTNAAAYENRLWFISGFGDDMSSWSDGAYQSLTANPTATRFDTVGGTGTRFYPSPTGTWMIWIKKEPTLSTVRSKVALFTTATTSKNIQIQINPNGGALTYSAGGTNGVDFGIIDGGADWVIWAKAPGAGMTRYYWGINEINTGASVGTTEYRRPMMVNADDANALWVEPFGAWVP